MTNRIAVLDDYQQVAASFAPWEEIDGEVTFFSDHLAEESAVVERLTGFDVIVAMRERTPFPAGRLAQLPDLRLLVTTGMRNASIDIDAARESGIVVCGTDIPEHPTAELTFTLILALARGLVDEVDSVRSGGWQVGVGRDLAGSTLGVIGLGRLGSQVARLGLAFGMRVVAWSENLTDDRAAEVGVERVEREELLAMSDVITIHLRLSDRTSGLIGAAEFELMAPHAHLVNTSRGPIVDTEALLAAVKIGSIAGAAVDVHDIEPLPPDHPLRSEPRILVTPHIGYVTQATYDVFYPQAVEDVIAWQQGKSIRCLTE